MAKKKPPIEVTPAGVAAYAWIDKPDTKFAANGEDGKYKLTVLIPKDGASKMTATIGGETVNGEELIASLQKEHEQSGGTAKNSPVKDGDKPLGNADKPKDDFKGHWLISLKSKFQPKLVDAKKNDIDPEGKLTVYSGDIVKAAYTRYDFDRGISLRLAAVQLIEKRSTGGAGAASAFGEEEGFEYEAGADAFGGGDDKPAATADANGDF